MKPKRKLNRTTKRSARPHRRPAPKPTTTALATRAQAPPPVVYQRNRRRVLTLEEVELLKRTIAKGASDDEFAMFLQVCRNHRLDPFMKQIYLIKRNTAKHHKEKRPTADGTGFIEVWIAGEIATIQMGIDGYRSMAARDHKDFGGLSKVTYDMSETKTPGGRLIPTAAHVEIRKKGYDHPVIATAFWDEFAPKKLDESAADFYNRMPRHMLAKCAEALAIRRGWPDMADIYTVEEMTSANMDYTEGNREITVDGVTSSGRIVDQADYSRHLQKDIVDQKLDDHAAHGHEPGSEKARIAEATLQRVEEADRVLREAKNVTPKPAPNAPIDAEPIWPKTERRPQPSTSSGNKEKPEAKSTSGQKKTEARPQSTAASGKSHFEPVLMTGTIQRSVAGMTGNNAPTRQVKLESGDKAVFHWCFRNTIFEFLDKGIGYVAEVYLDARNNIVGLKRIGSREFDEDGATPITQRKDQQAGTGSLFNGK